MSAHDDTTLVPPRPAAPEDTTLPPPAQPGHSDTTLGGSPATAAAERAAAETAVPRPAAPEDETRDGSRPATPSGPPRAGSPPVGAPVPARIGAYELERELGRGAVGAVWLATDTRLGRRVALKLLRAGEGATPAEVERFHLEARAASRLSHPHVVAIHEVGQADGLCYLAMDRVEGPTLRERLEQGPLEPREAARIAACLGRALHHAHSHGILHRDVKPGNVLLDPAGEPRLTDFGLAKDLGAEQGLTVTGDVLGTPAYMSPEQAAGDAALVDRRSDVWGLGATLYALLCGRPPFTGATVLELLGRLAGEEPAPPSRLRPGLPRDLDTIALHCLEKDPARRYATAAELADDLERFLAHQPIHARPATPLDRAGKWLRRNRAAAWTAGAVAAVSALVIVVGSLAFALRLGEAARRADASAAEARQHARRAEQNQELARQQAARADEQARQANERSQIAYRSLTALVVEVQKQLRDLPGERPRAVREKLLQDALRELSRLRQTEPADAPITLLAAEAQRAWGELLDDAGREDEAEAALQEALRMARRLAAEDPAAEAASGLLGVCLDSLGDRRRSVGDLAGAGALYAESLAARRAALDRSPGDLEARRNLGVALDRAGDVARERGDLPAARALYEEWLAVCRALSAAAPERPRLKVEEGFALRALGQVLKEQGDLAGAQARFEEVLAVCSALVERDPEDVLALETLAQARGDLGELHHLRLELPAARAAHEAAVEVYRRLRRLDPGPGADYALSRALGEAGQVCVTAGDLPAARAHLEEAAALRREVLRREPGNAAARRAVVGSLLDLADLAREAREAPAALAGYREAAERARELVAADPSNAQDTLNLAVILSRQAEVQAQAGQTAEALAALEQADPLVRGLEERDPSNYQLPFLRSQLRELAGQLHRAAGQDELALGAFQDALLAARRMLALAPAHANALDRVCGRLNQVAELLAARGQRREALAAWLEAMELCRRRVAEEGPKNEVVFRNVSIYARKAVLAHLALKDHPAALELARVAHAHHAEVVARSPAQRHELKILAWDHAWCAALLTAEREGAEAEALAAEGRAALGEVVRLRREELAGLEARLASASPAEASGLRLQLERQRAELAAIRDEPTLAPLRRDRPAFERALQGE